MSGKTYQFHLDSYGRWATEICAGTTAAFKLLSEGDVRRLNKGQYAFIVLDQETPLGTLRARNIKIVRPRSSSLFVVHWPQSVLSGAPRSDGRPDRLDLIGPLSRSDRESINQTLLEAFHQLRTQAHEGTLGLDGRGA